MFSWNAGSFIWINLHTAALRSRKHKAVASFLYIKKKKILYTFYEVMHPAPWASHRTASLRLQLVLNDVRKCNLRQKVCLGLDIHSISLFCFVSVVRHFLSLCYTLHSNQIIKKKHLDKMKQPHPSTSPIKSHFRREPLHLVSKWPRCPSEQALKGAVH